MTKIERLLIQLIKIDSSKNNEEEIAEFIIKELGKEFIITKQYVDEKRYNIFAKKGNSNVFIVAHIDTVVGDVKIGMNDKRIYGRGACDNKGNVAGAIIAAKKMKDVNLIFTVGEEKDFDGAKLASKKIKKDSKVIVMEGTNLKIANEQTGVIVAKIIAKDKARHSSLKSDELEGATEKLCSYLSYLEACKFNGFNIGKISGGIAPNIVSDYAEAEISFRPKDEEEFRFLIDELTLRNTIVIKEITKKIKPVESNIRIKGYKMIPLLGFTEMYFFKNSVVFGAGSLKNAHTDNESISKKELNELPNKLINLYNKINEYKKI
jgi:acetylornithine deacetylase